MNKEFNYEMLTSEEISTCIKNNKILLLSFGSIEQHSTHLPVATDYLCSYERAKIIAQNTNSILFSPLKLGYSFYHLGMVGTISLSAKLFISIVNEIIEQLCEQGWRRFIVFSGHAGNWSAIEVSIQMAREKYPLSQFIISKGLPRLSEHQNIKRFFDEFDRHAGKVETALISYFLNNYLDEKNIPSSNTKLPSKITKHLKKNNYDEIDCLLIDAYLPQKTSLIANAGNWGLQDPHSYNEIPVKQAMDRYIDYFTELINRWNLWEDE